MALRPMTDWTFTPQPFGRYLIDLPAGTRLTGWTQHTTSTGWINVEQGITPEMFRKAVAYRMDELSRGSAGKKPMQFQRLDLAPGQRLALIFEKPPHAAWHDYEAYCLRGSTLFQIGYFLEEDGSGDIPGQLNRLLDRLVPRGPGELPAGPGTCFGGGYIADDDDWGTSDMFSASGIWDQRPDVRFRLNVYRRTPSQQNSLMERMVLAKSIPSWINRLRWDWTREAGGVKGEEICERIKGRNGHRGHLFIWETRGRINSVVYPQIRLEMATGDGRGGSSSSLTDAEALAIWDRMLGSLRWRTGPPKESPWVLPAERQAQ